MAIPSPLQGWHSRALQTPHPEPHSFTPTPESLILTVLLNAQADDEGISLALFSEAKTGQTIAIDALGKVSFVAPKDSDGILSLARCSLALPDTGTWRNTWVIKHIATSQPIHRIFVPTSQPGQLKQISVQGFSKKTRELSEPVKGLHELPSELYELTDLLLEAREGVRTGEKDVLVLDKVRSVINAKGLFQVTK